MTEGGTVDYPNGVSTKHPHDEPPMLDPEGRCLVCSRLYHLQVIDRLTARVAELEAENRAWVVPMDQRPICVRDGQHCKSWGCLFTPYCAPQSSRNDG